MRFLASLLFLTVALVAQTTSSWVIAGSTRTALVYAPAKIERDTPVILVFHGHGGSASRAAMQMRIHELWPSAVVIYPQGLLTRGQITDPEGTKTGWRCDDSADNRDLQFFDAISASYPGRRLFVTGHSNGGSFTYCLASCRVNKLVAIAPSAAVYARGRLLSPIPTLHLGAKNDPLVKYSWQREMMEQVKKTNASKAEGVADSLGDGAEARGCVFFQGRAPFVSYIHEGGHSFPTETGPSLIVRFFKAQLQALP